MSIEKSKAQDQVSSILSANKGASERVGAGGVFTVTCIGADGVEKWSDSFHNLVVNVGLQDMNAKYFEGSSYTAAWYLGLVSGATSPTYAAADTLASHAGWTELVPGTAYSTSGGSVRATVTWNAASPTLADPSVASNSVAPSAFSMLVNSTTVAGAFLTTASSGTSGILFSEGNFTGGNKAVDAGDTLNVTYQFSLDAA
jgi:hypothetical protein